jgi:hypothetical protein
MQGLIGHTLKALDANKDGKIKKGFLLFILRSGIELLECLSYQTLV